MYMLPSIENDIELPFWKAGTNASINVPTNEINNPIASCLSSFSLRTIIPPIMVKIGPAVVIKLASIEVVFVSPRYRKLSATVTPINSIKTIIRIFLTTLFSLGRKYKNTGNAQIPATTNL